MTGTTIPILLAVLGLIAGLAANRAIRRGGARFYALERDAILRRASFILLGSLFLFAGSVSLLVYNIQLTESALEEATIVAETVGAQPVVQIEVTLPPATTTDSNSIESAPPTVEPEPTEDPDQPTPTPTPIIRRGIVENTGGSGAYMRDGPGTNFQDLQILQDGDIVELIDEEEPVDANGYTWYKVRTITREEGWVVSIFLTIQQR